MELPESTVCMCSVKSHRCWLMKWTGDGWRMALTYYPAPRMRPSSRQFCWKCYAIVKWDVGPLVLVAKHIILFYIHILKNPRWIGENSEFQFFVSGISSSTACKNCARNSCTNSKQFTPSLLTQIWIQMMVNDINDIKIFLLPYNSFFF